MDGILYHYADQYYAPAGDSDGDGLPDAPYAGTWPGSGAAQAGGFAPSGFGTWSSLAAKLREWIAAEAGAGRCSVMRRISAHEALMTLNGPPLLGKCSGAEQLAEANAFEAAPIGDGTAVGGFDDDLEVWRYTRARDILKGERIDVPFVGDEVEIRTDPLLGRMDEAEVADDIDDPEIFIASRGFHDLFCGRYDDEGGELQLGMDRHDVLCVVLDGAG